MQRHVIVGNIGKLEYYFDCKQYRWVDDPNNASAFNFANVAEDAMVFAPNDHRSLEVQNIRVKLVKLREPLEGLT